MQKKAIKDVFVNSFGSETVVPPSDEALELMEICVEMLGWNHISKASIVLAEGVKANLSKSKGSIKVERVETIKSSMEA